jgi:hypothetical protein
MHQNPVGRHGRGGCTLTGADFGEKGFRIWLASEIYELGSEVLLERASGLRRSGGELISRFIGYIANGDRRHSSILLLSAALCNHCPAGCPGGQCLGVFQMTGMRRARSLAIPIGARQLSPPTTTGDRLRVSLMLTCGMLTCGPDRIGDAAYVAYAGAWRSSVTGRSVQLSMSRALYYLGVVHRPREATLTTPQHLCDPRSPPEDSEPVKRNAGAS